MSCEVASNEQHVAISPKQVAFTTRKFFFKARFIGVVLRRQLFTGKSNFSLVVNCHWINAMLPSNFTTVLLSHQISN